MKNIALAMVIISLIAAATVLNVYGHGEVVATCFAMALFLFMMLDSSI